MNDELQKQLNELVAQCDLFLQILPDDEINAITIVDNLKGQINKIISQQLDQHDKENSILTRRESEILNLIFIGHANKEIAYKLGISIKTVQFHIKNLFIKTKSQSRTELINKSLKLGLLKKT